MTAEAQEPGSWAPGFLGQRPPFPPGNDAAVTHGARSERRVSALAAQIAQDLLDDPDTPDHVREPMFGASVEAWAHAEAIARLLRAHIDEQISQGGLETALAAEAVTDEDETRSKGKTHRRTTARSLPSNLEMLRKYETTAMNLRSRLGLDPSSAAKVGRDLAAARSLNVNATPLAEALAKISEQRQLAAGSGDG